MEAASIPAAGGGPPAGGGHHEKMERSSASRLADPAFQTVLTVLATGVLLLIAFFFYFLAKQAEPIFSQTGILGFIFDNDWNPSKSIYGAWPLVVGTIITSAIALIIGVPIAVATALYITQMAPARIKAPLTVLVELLAAVPSVVYGLWGVYFLIPQLKPVETFIADTLGSFIPFLSGPVAGPNYFIAGLILAIMILPIVSAISREVFDTVPPDHKEAALALGATRWEMMRIAVLPYSRAGVTSASMLGLGRAVGETIAVTLVVGNSPTIGDSIFSQGYTLAAVIANEFGEAANDELHAAALIAAGLVLFVLTLIINGIARYIVVRAERKQTGRPSRGPTTTALTPTPIAVQD